MVPPGWTVKKTGTALFLGSGNGGRSTGIAVMPSSVTVLPCSSRITEPLGIRTSSPGICGVVSVMSRLAGASKVTVCFVSSGVIQTGKPRSAVRPAVGWMRMS